MLIKTPLGLEIDWRSIESHVTTTRRWLDENKETSVRGCHNGAWKCPELAKVQKFEQFWGVDLFKIDDEILHSRKLGWGVGGNFAGGLRPESTKLCGLVAAYNLGSQGKTWE